MLERFFVRNKCEELEKIFLSSSPSIGEKISAATAKSSGLYDAIMRYREYTSALNNPYSTVAKSILIEILYLLNNISTFEGTAVINENLADVIHYLNNNFSDIQKNNLMVLQKSRLFAILIGAWERG